MTRVLIAEDSLESQKLIQSYLRSLSLDCVTVGDGKALIEKAISENFALLLVDASLPLVDGVEAVRTIRQNGYKGPIVSISASMSADDVERYRDAGFDDCLGKPFNREQFLETVRKFVDGTEPRATSTEYDSLRDAFAVDLPRKFDEIRAAYQRKDFVQVKFLAHKTRAAAMFGFSAIANLCAEIDNELQAGKDDQIRTLLARLEEEVGNIAKQRA